MNPDQTAPFSQTRKQERQPDKSRCGIKMNLLLFSYCRVGHMLHVKHGLEYFHGVVHFESRSNTGGHQRNYREIAST